MRAFEFVADNPGDWAFHCHKSHHAMNAMGHNVPTMIGVDHRGVAEKINKLVPDYMVMGERGMADMGAMEMPLPDNTLPMMSGSGPVRRRSRWAGCSRVVKVREGLARGDYKDPGWYKHPPGTVAYEWTGEAPAASARRAGAAKRAVAQRAQAAGRPLRTLIDRKGAYMTISHCSFRRRPGCIRAARAWRTKMPGKQSRPVSTEETAFGREGDPKKVSRTVKVDMSDRMRFTPAELAVKQGETVRFGVKNSGKVMHEMVLGTMDELKEHAELMKKHPGMEHDEPYMAHVAPGKTETMVWQFTKPGEFYYGCLVPGHFEAGMVGKVRVTP